MKRARQPLEKSESKKRKKNQVQDNEAEQAASLKYLEITTKGLAIFPTNIRKYHGAICVIKQTNKWQTRIQHLKCEGREHKTHKTRDEAEAYIKEINIEKKWPIKNVVYLYNDEYYCLLTRNQIMKFSIENLDIVESRCWNAHKDSSTGSYYASTGFKPTLSFHRLVCPSPNKQYSTDHINRSTLDNTIPNLRVASLVTQNINQKIKRLNTTGIRGVKYNKRCNRYSASWSDHNDKRVCPTKCFSVLKYGDEQAKAMAIQYRKEKESSLEHYKLALCK